MSVLLLNILGLKEFFFFNNSLFCCCKSSCLSKNFQSSFIFIHHKVTVHNMQELVVCRYI